MKAISIISILAILLACNNASQPGTEATSGTTQTIANGPDPATGASCYLFVAAKDTYAVQLNIIDTLVRGTAVFKNDQKDSSHGTVEGEMEGDIVHLWYNFQSEGRNSIRELFFKKEGDRLVTGIAPETARGDSAFVLDTKEVSYTGPVYAQGDCAAVPQL